MKGIQEDLKTGRFQPVYLLYGEEAYLKRQYRQKLRQALAAEGDAMNVSQYQGAPINPGEIIDLAETLPFFADRRVIVMETAACLNMAGNSWRNIYRNRHRAHILFWWKRKRINAASFLKPFLPKGWR